MAMVLVLLMTCSSVIFAKSGDYQGHWAEKSIQNWIDKGYIKGYADGSFKPENNITRAEFICLVNRSFGFTEQKAVTYKDVKESHWAYNEFQRATGYIAGFEDGTLRPNNKITRQEVAAIITRLLNTKKAKNSEAFLGLDDFEKIPEWSAGAVSAMVNEGYMNLRNGNSFAPAAPATRAEVIAALDAGYLNFVKTKYKEAGTYTGGLIDGSVEINAKDVILENTTINGNLIIGEDVGKGNVTLRKVNVKGDTIVKGGGMDTIIIEDSYIKNLIIEKKDGKVRILAKGSTYIDDVDLQSGGKLEAYNKKSNNFGYVVIAENLSSDEPIILAGNFYQVEIRSGENEIQIASGTIKDLTITKSAKNVKVMTASGAKIDFVEINTPATIDGKGEVGRARVNSDGVRMIEPKETLDKNKDVDKVEIIKPSISTGGDGGGGSSTPVNKEVSAISVNPTTMELTVGGATGTITATVLPTTATNKKVTWTSSDTTIATVVNGVVTPKVAGTTTITAKTVDGEKTATCVVTVNEAPVTLDSIAITTPASKTIYTVGETLDITGLVVTGTYSDSSTKAETITTANVSGFNSAAAVASQTLTITVGGKTATYTVNINKVVVAVSAITVTPVNLELTVGGATKTITATVSPTDATNKNVTWTSSNIAVATVANGVVTPKTAGTTTITATTVDGEKTATCVVTVKAAVVNKTVLTTAISAANTNKSTAVISTDGSNVLPANKWVTTEEMAAYTNAITAAQGVVDNGTATQIEIDGAVTTLATETSTFNTAKKAGTKPASDVAIATPAIAGVTAPVTGATPVSTIAETSEYTATISWDLADTTFAASAVYTATITITPKAGYTLTGVAANFFTVAGATTVNNTANTGVVTAVFPATGAINKAALSTAISAATTNKGTAAVSTDGKDIDPANKWVTAAEMTAYTNAITTAQGVFNNISATETDVANAVTNLATATSAFNTAKKAGTKPAADTTPPVITASDETVTLASLAAWTGTVSATDNVDGNITANIVATYFQSDGSTSLTDLAAAKTYIGDATTNTSFVVKYNVSDAAGNAATEVVVRITVTKANVPNSISVGGKTLDSTNLYLVDGNPEPTGTLGDSNCTAYFDPITGVLSLQGYVGGVIRNDNSGKDLSIKLIGNENKITGEQFGIYNYSGDIHITSENIAKLELKANSYGIATGVVAGSAQTGSVLISGKAKVTVLCENESSVMTGIEAPINVTIQNEASFDATLKGTSNAARGVFANNIIIDTIGNIEIDVSNSVQGIGIFAYGGIEISKVNPMLITIHSSGENTNTKFTTGTVDVSSGVAVNKSTTRASYRSGTPYTLEIVDGNITSATGEIIGSPNHQYLKDDVITIQSTISEANFDKWTKADGTALEESLFTGSYTENSATATIKMPAANLSIKAKEKDAKISIAEIPGVTGPVTGATPVAVITETAQYTGTVVWNESPVNFAANTVYTATITLTPKTGYTLTGVTENLFTVGGATATNAVDSGVVIAVFPATVAPATLQSIVITTPATKTEYKVGDELDITGMVVTGTYSDSTTKVETINASNVTGFDSSAVAASQTLTVTVDGETATYTISVVKADGPKAPLVESFKTSTPEDKIMLENNGTIFTVKVGTNKTDLYEYSIGESGTWENLPTGTTPAEGEAILIRAKETVTRKAGEAAKVLLSEGYVFNSNTGTIINYAGTATVLDIPSKIDEVNVTKIDDSAFKDKGLTSVVIPGTIQSIGNIAFMNNALTSITILSSVTYLGTGAFSTNKLTEVTIPNSVDIMGFNVFEKNGPNKNSGNIGGVERPLYSVYVGTWKLVDGSTIWTKE